MGTKTDYLIEKYLVKKNEFANLSISQIANIIRKDWKKVNYAAKPYLDAMFALEKITDNYMMDSGTSVVAYFLSNASKWKGEVAKAVKKELNKRLKGKK
jgi:hypothetical protein